ncbi:prepilin peptidase [Pseudomonas sp. UBA4194]|uniref:prepilin peptidase n=1 Tax=Pseudomonas sp. UBA4194 TaxID=1947317 RepID=UPI0025F910AC|nr:prepilin peptidase [Pseudomonas sp. UBA4194]
MPSLVLLLWFTLCAEQDIRQRRIADTLTLGAGSLALVCLFTTGHTWIGSSMVQAAAALALSMALTLPGYLSGRLGRGEVQLLWALALASDSNHLVGTLIGGVLAIVVWVFVGPMLWYRLTIRYRRKVAYLDPESPTPLPLTPFLLVGFVLTLFWLS